MGLTIYFAACLRDTSPNGSVGRQTDTLGLLGKLDFQEEKNVVLFIKLLPFYNYDVLKESHLIRTQFSCETTRYRTCLDELSTTYSENQQEKSCLLFVHARDPSQLALVPCTLSAVDKRGRKT